MLVICLGMVTAIVGCGPVVMINKMVFGDPEIDSPFKLATGVDLTEGKHKVIIICDAPSAIRDGDMTGLSHQLVETLTRQLQREGVKVVESNDVRDWMDDNGGRLDDPRDLADEFDVDFIIHVDLLSVSFYEENSPDLFRGQAHGDLIGYRVETEDDEDSDEGERRMARQVFSSGFGSTYPEFSPIPASQVDSPRIFQRRFVQRLASQLGHILHDHTAGTEVF
ncbi:hypothetical protein [Thalassoroseus pseudoceratinae]|uniref:hypothetical protein n=1 Tax=Thalassoroseus pseudoceratinae TaxID=2713176 RepID=UPI0014229189|nr:hypothetical protein [Thalassoroseus pseudoceratinae]